jgi:hypothetical protein
MSLCSALADYLRVAIYESHAKLHWPPRLAHCLQAIEQVYPSVALHGPVRIIDIGSGPGMLFPSVCGMNLSYLALEIDHQSVLLAQKRYAHFANFEIRESASIDPSVVFTRTDIVILNGVFHHLANGEAAELLGKMKEAGAVIILDHLKRENPDRFSMVEQTQRMIQFLDRGKYVRPLSYYKELGIQPLKMIACFTISVMKFPLWPYFVAIYTDQE